MNTALSQSGLRDAAKDGDSRNNEEYVRFGMVVETRRERDEARQERDEARRALAEIHKVLCTVAKFPYSEE